MRRVSFSLPSYAAILLSFASEASADTRRGYVTARYCPYKCETAGIPKKNCRDWREGDICFIEDLRRAPGRGPMPPPRAAPHPWGTPRPIPRPTFPYANDCRNADRHDLARPRIDIYDADRTGGFFQDKYRIRGTVEGACLIEAAYFEDGRKVADIPIVTTRDFRRFDFQTTIRKNRSPEIRVYNVSGDRDVARVDLSENGYRDPDRDPPPYYDPWRDRDRDPYWDPKRRRDPWEW